MSPDGGRPDGGRFTVRGPASAEEIAAVVAVLESRRGSRRGAHADDPLQRWRRLRQTVTRTVARTSTSPVTPP